MVRRLVCSGTNLNFNAFHLLNVFASRLLAAQFFLPSLATTCLGLSQTRDGETRTIGPQQIATLFSRRFNLDDDLSNSILIDRSGSLTAGSRCQRQKSVEPCFIALLFDVAKISIAAQDFAQSLLRQRHCKTRLALNSRPIGGFSAG